MNGSPGSQLISAGTVAHGVVLGAQAHGFSALWRTGPAAYDPHVQRPLGLEPGEQIAAFVYVGTAALPPPPIERPRYDSCVREWTGPA